jgi:hypothetical protein
MSDLAERLATNARRGTVLAYITGNAIASIGVLLVCVLAVVAVAGPWIVPQDPLEQSFLTAARVHRRNTGSARTRAEETCFRAFCWARGHRCRSA